MSESAKPSNHAARGQRTSNLLARQSEAPTAAWDQSYEQEAVPWRSGGLSRTAQRLVADHADGSNLLEVGCGLGSDLRALAAMGFDCVGIDASPAAIRLARSGETLNVRFISADFFRWSPDWLFDVAYEKGFFHGLAGVRRRNAFLRRVAGMLRPGGLWITVCGAADHRRSDFCHGAIYLRDLIAPAEIYFEVIEVVKATYGLADSEHDFYAWHAAFRRR